MVDMYPKEAIFACHLVKGSACFDQGGVQLVVNAGDTLIYDTRRPFRLAFPSEMQELLIDIPVTELEACRRPKWLLPGTWAIPRCARPTWPGTPAFRYVT
jgi:hypothetical protein